MSPTTNQTQPRQEIELRGLAKAFGVGLEDWKLVVSDSDVPGAKGRLRDSHSIVWVSFL